jgi:heme-degrading monooxygenase HmoA
MWEFHVASGKEKEFKRAYDANGTWARFFSQETGYKKTMLLPQKERHHSYVTVDIWDSEEAYKLFREKHLHEYNTIDNICEELTESEKHIISFSL